MSLHKIIKESIDDFDWIKDVKTNRDIAQEIYDGLKWHKEGVSYIVRTQWSDIPFLVTPTNISKHGAKITPAVFYRGFVKYVINTWAIHGMEEWKEIYWSVRGLIGQKINNNLNESVLVEDPLIWINDIESSIDIDNLSGYYFTWEDHLNRKFYIKDYIGEFEFSSLGSRW